ncbi:ribonuclease HI [Ferroacidibacillus organovorans]|uniref:Ribonuclease H n=1 Tax=Ferroacidibacillus organovorans TaxID=1765683 RepID=A0A162UVP2_9BACL|nr:ribonuclease HI [Ferroacidibacillus organovorans]KYP82077.1 ribonuclease H [Ferroacidibacillus organovorans]OAG94397.1 ribonuclease H [Ferroacidibacillus organovorans]OPG15266.1 ribonuclease HI [Ferroacidibacillus organovorans]
MSQVHVELYTDGACSGNPGPGGWSAILVNGAKERELSGGEAETTNQRMEILAAVEGLKALKKPCEVALHSDSAYLINCINEKWYVKWRKNGWVNSKKEAVKNRDLWEQLLPLLDVHHVTFVKVKGHSGHAYNERCDALARAAVGGKKRAE